jgi:Sulphur transport
MTTLSRLVFAFPCALLMGVAIQRGSTCLVAGVQEWVEQRDPRRLLALGEGAAWCGALLALASFVADGSFSGAHVVTGWTLLGGMLLGFGAWVNGACVFGSVAAIGAGDCSYLAFPVGLALGTAVVQQASLLFGSAAAGIVSPLAIAAPVPFSQLVPFWLVVAGGLLLAGAWRRYRRQRSARHEAPSAEIEPGEWPARAGVILACVASATMALVFGRWVYSDAIASWVRGEIALADARFLLFPTLLLGALAGGWSRGKCRFRPPQPSVVWRCLLGGGLMAIGAQLVPGANDGMLLFGLPTLAPEALVGMVAMVVTVAVLMVGMRRLRRLSTD